MKSTYSTSEMRKIESDAFKRGVGTALRAVVASVALELLDKRRFTQEYTQSILDAIQERFDAVYEGYLNVDDMLQILDEEYDIKIG